MMGSKFSNHIGGEVNMSWGHIRVLFGGRMKYIFVNKIIFAVQLLNGEEIDDLKPAKIKSIWFVSWGVFENTCSLRASEKILKVVLIICRPEGLLKQNYFHPSALQANLSIWLFICLSGKATTKTLSLDLPAKVLKGI